MIQRIAFQLLLATFVAFVVPLGFVWWFGAMLRRFILSIGLRHRVGHKIARQLNPR